MGKSSFLQEFKTFAMRGNVIDLAVGVIIGGAFNTIVSSLVADVIMPPIGLLMGGVNFTDLDLTLKAPQYAADGTEIAAGVAIKYGNFLQAVFNFLIVAFSVFMLVKMVNRFSHKKEAQKAAEPAKPTKEEELLTEIRDLLKQQSQPTQPTQ